MVPRVAKVTDSTVTAHHQGQYRDAGDNRCFRHRAHPIDPAAMIVEARCRDPRCQRLAQRCEVRSHAGRDLHDDQAWDRQIIESKTGAQPWLHEPGGFFLGEGPHFGNAGCGARDIRSSTHVSVNIAARRGPNLDGDLAADLRLPIAGRAHDQHRRTGGQRCQERHDGDDDRERASGDRILSARSAQRPARCARPKAVRRTRPTAPPWSRQVQS